MKVILTQDVANLGVLGDEVQVKPGYARNFLVPQGKAILLTDKHSKEIQHRRRYLEKLRQEAINQAKQQAEKLLAQTLEITKKAGLGGRLFGSVSNKDIQDLLATLGYTVDRRAILAHEPIKTVGTHKVSVKLHTSVKLDVVIKVVGEFDKEAMKSKEEAPAEAPEAASEASEQAAA